MRTKPALFVLALLLAIAACAGPDTRCASLPGGGRYCLQPTTAIAPFEAQQKVEAAFGGRRETMIAEIEADANGMRLVVLTPFGQKLVQIGFDNRDAQAMTRPDPRLDPALILALLQLALWPAEAVRAGLGERLALEEFDGQRRILMDGNAILAVRYVGTAAPYRRLHLVLPSAGLELDVETLLDTETQQ
jgi:hypothetical protein